MKKPLRLAGALAALALVAAACGDSGSAATVAETTTTPAPAITEAPATTPAPTTTPPTTAAPAPALTLSVEGFSALEAGFHYEGWAIVDGAPVSTGKFNVTADGDIVDLGGAAITSFPLADGAENAATIVITIEPSGDTDAIPAATHVVAGDVAAGTADLTIAHPAALGADFSEASGKFVLATPSTDTKDDELSGIWFLTLPGPEAGLSLPTLPEGWKYEGWAVIDGTPLTSGTFTDVAARGRLSSIRRSRPHAGLFR